MEVTITQIIDRGMPVSAGSDISWLSCRTANGKKVVFWGSPCGGTRNIDSLRNQAFPVRIFIESPEDCVPSQHQKSKCGINISVPEDVIIQIDPEV